MLYSLLFAYIETNLKAYMLSYHVSVTEANY